MPVQWPILNMGSRDGTTPSDAVQADCVDVTGLAGCRGSGIIAIKTAKLIHPVRI